MPVKESYVHLTDSPHTPAVALGTKDESLLATWTLVIQAYDLHIVYCKGQHSNNANTLSKIAQTSHCVIATTGALPATEDI